MEKLLGRVDCCLSNGKKVKVSSLRDETSVLFLLLVLVSLFASGHCRMTNFPDCMKNPFAANCRGISAKRSFPQQPAATRLAELAPSQQDIWQPDFPAATTRQAISHRSQQPQNSLFYQLLLPIPTLNVNYKTPPGQQQQQQLNGNNNAFEVSLEG